MWWVATTRFEGAEGATSVGWAYAKGHPNCNALIFKDIRFSFLQEMLQALDLAGENGETTAGPPRRLVSLTAGNG